MISLQAYLMGREVEFPPTAEMLAGANSLLQKVESFLYDLGIDHDDEDVSSGYRPGYYNTIAGGSDNSCHLKCVAVDLNKKTRNAVLSKFPEWNTPRTQDRKKLEELLETHGLYLENPFHTKSWMHLQTRKTRNRIFIP